MTQERKPTFAVDKRGLAKILERRGKDFAVIELVQNSWDEDTTRVDVTLESVGHGKARLVVEDDNPEGFKDLAHAYTLFAESAKKADPTKRGRFNLGEKLVIAICDEATISTTKGTIAFDDKGRIHKRATRESGTRFEGIMRLNKQDVEAVETAIFTLIPPANIQTFYNGSEVPRRTPLRTFEATLRTEAADSEGRLKPTTRKTTIAIYEPAEGETPSLYEMGLPVVETGDRWHVDIGQKVPLNTDRDNVPPGWLRDVRAYVLNHAHDLLIEDDADAKWLDHAIEDENIEPEAVTAVVTKRYGEGAVRFDPTDVEANKIAMEQGRTVIPGSAFSKQAWGNVKTTSAALPAGRVTPSPNPNEDDDNIKLMDPDAWPDGVRNIVALTRTLAMTLLGHDISVRVANDPGWQFSATYGRGGSLGPSQFTFNLGRLGYSWFNEGPSERVLSLILHEFGHEYCSDHFDRAYLRALTNLGARLALAVQQDSNLLAQYEAVTA